MTSLQFNKIINKVNNKVGLTIFLNIQLKKFVFFAIRLHGHIGWRYSFVLGSYLKLIVDLLQQ